MARKFPEHPSRPERICWGCDRYCPAEALACGNGSERTPHPVELFGEDWLAWSPAGVPPAGDATPGPGQAPGRSPETHE